MWTIRETADGWQLVAADGSVVTTLARYDQVLALLGEKLAAAAVSGDGSGGAGADGAGGLLPETWSDVDGICFNEDTGDGRDFTGCVWSSRDPAVSMMPLMLQTETEVGHFGAELAGFIETLETPAGGPPRATGRFYDSPVGIQFRDMLLEGRRFGVSVDNGSVEYEWVCIEFDPEAGWCTQESMVFSAYEIIGLTGTPFPGFAKAAIQLGASASTAPAAPAAASGAPATAAARFPAVPPRTWLEMAEPQLGSPLLVQQIPDELIDDIGEKWAVPMTITDEGHVFGHLAWWGQCHIAYHDVCVEPPHSPTAYSKVNLRALPVDGGGSVLTGPLVVGTDHADVRLFDARAKDEWANSNLAWADVHFIDGAFGPWFSGAVRPDLTDAQLRVLRASSVSGEWYDEDGLGLDLFLGLTVSGPGYPIRAAALAASGLSVNPPQHRARVKDGRVVALSAANIVRRQCSTCGQGASHAAHGPGDLARIESLLGVLERRTRHLGVAEAADRASRLAVMGAASS